MPRNYRKKGTPVGRPATARAKFDTGKFETLMLLKPTKEMVAFGLKISKASLERCITQHYPGETFETLAERFGAEVSLSLRQRVLRGAMNGDRTLLIFASKAFAGLRDRVEIAKDPEQHKAELAVETAKQTAEGVRVAAVLAALRG